MAQTKPQGAEKPQASQPEDVLKDEHGVNQGSIFDKFLEEDITSDKSRDDIIRELIASGNAKRVNGLTVRNVVATPLENHDLLTFVVDRVVVGSVRDENEVDAFGKPVVKLGKTHNVQTSSYAVAGVMKDFPKLAIFANDLVTDPTLATMLFAGSKIDIVMQFVEAGDEYVNPFSSNPKPHVFEKDKVIHHVVGLTLGEVGHDMYRERISRA